MWGTVMVRIEEASCKDIDEIVFLKQSIWNEMKNKDWYVISGTNKEFLNDVLKREGMILKAVDGDTIVGFLIIENHLNADSEIIKKLHLEKDIDFCIEMDNAGVKREYRGNKLQEQMLKEAEVKMTSKYKIKYILATVHPDNKASLRSLLSMGYQIQSLEEMYQGKKRYIVYKNIGL